MEEWYMQLITNVSRASHCFIHDYFPYSQILSTFSGLVLDIGGGNGLIRHFLPDSVEYITLEPSTIWYQTEWDALAETFPCLKTRPNFVRGVGEFLPFAAETFDAVLSFWSLNHVGQPASLFQEAYQVLKRDGRFLLVLEDMQPRWSELNHTTPGWSQLKNIVLAKLWCAVGRPWPVQADHIYISEKELHQWRSPYFGLSYRRWVRGYLTFEFEKKSRS